MGEIIEVVVNDVEDSECVAVAVAVAVAVIVIVIVQRHVQRQHIIIILNTPITIRLTVTHVYIEGFSEASF